MRLYGQEWPAHMQVWQIELACYRLDIANGSFWHLKRACQMLFPSPNYEWHEWSDLRFEAFCKHRYQTWWGSASTAKTTDAAVLCLLDWLASPADTASHVLSTTDEMLRKRIFGEVTRYYKLHENVFPGKIRDSDKCIVYDVGRTVKTAKAGIFGHAVQMSDKALGNLSGIHMRRNRIFLDEMQSCREAAYKMTANAFASGSGKFLGFGNPESRNDLLGRKSEPKHGWNSIDTMSADDWETKVGHCYVFDGRKSPGINEPKRLWFLITKEHIEHIAKEEGEDSPVYWSQCIGRIPPGGTGRSLWDYRTADQFNVYNVEVFERAMFWFAGFDPSSFNGGDRAFLSLGRFGVAQSGKPVIQFEEDVEDFQDLLPADEDTAKTFLFARALISICEDRKIEKKNFALDITGMQSHLADIVDELWPGNQRIHRVDFAGTPTDARISKTDKRLAKDVYRDRSTELFFLIYQYGKHDMLRGLSNAAVEELIQRDVDFQYGKRKVESKVKFRGKHGYSPDDSDSKLCALDLLRTRHGLIPGFSLSARAAQRRAAGRRGRSVRMLGPPSYGAPI